MKLRVPYWATAGFTVKVNGEVVVSDAEPSTYVSAGTKWNDGDIITVSMPFKAYIEKTPDKRDGYDIASIKYGPLVMVTQNAAKSFLTLTLPENIDNTSLAIKNGPDENNLYTMDINGRHFIPIYSAHNYSPYHTYFYLVTLGSVESNVDKTELYAKLDAANSYDESDYTAGSYANLVDAITAAAEIYRKADATEAEVNTALENLNAAITGLVLINEGPVAALSADSVVQPDSTFTVAVSLDNLEQGVFAEDITLSYDDDVFEYVAAEAANDNIHIVKETPGDGTVRIIAANVGGVTGLSTPILYVNFKVKSGVQNTSGIIAIAKAELGVAPEGIIITPHLTSKSIEVTTPVDRTALVAAIDSAQTLYDNAVVGTQPGQYPEVTKEALLVAMNAANAVLLDGTATQADVDQAVMALNNAVNSFKASVNKEPEVDKSILSALINAVQNLYDAAVTGMQNGQYPEAAKAALLSAINSAKAVLNNSNATQPEVNSEVTALNEAKDIFEATIITELSGDINKDGSINVGDLAIAAYYYGRTIESLDWSEAKVADVNYDGEIDIQDLAFIALRIVD